MSKQFAVSTPPHAGAIEAIIHAAGASAALAGHEQPSLVELLQEAASQRQSRDRVTACWSRMMRRGFEKGTGRY